MNEAGWIHEPKPKHVCIMPTQTELDKRFEGAIWCCGECGAYYEVAWNRDPADGRVHGRDVVGRKEMHPISPADVEARLRPKISA